MKYRIKLKIGWTGKKWYVLQKKVMFFWLDIHDYETYESAIDTKNELLSIN